MIRSLVHAAGGILHAGGAFRVLQRLTLPDVVSIAMYHGVTAQPLRVRDWCFTSAAAFSRQMEYLARHFTVLHLEEALASERHPAARPVACVTFDDGFKSVHDIALPVLERLRIPATVYLVTDLIGSDQTVWFARLHQAVAETAVPSVTHRGERFALSDAWSRSQASARLQRLVKALPEGEHEAALEELLEQLGFGGPRRPQVAPEFRMLSSAQIQRMGRDDLVRFGGHTATHQILTRASPDRAFREVERSVRAVAQLTGRPSISFAYPNGGGDDFDERAVESLKRVGVRYGVTTVDGPNTRDVDPYRIRRSGIASDDPLARFAWLMHQGRAATRRLLGRMRDR
jgi:peptidoglycan/xylan/chitin deacetylase (PgdA/CDA1 family)